MGSSAKDQGSQHGSASETVARITILSRCTAGSSRNPADSMVWAVFRSSRACALEGQRLARSSLRFSVLPNEVAHWSLTALRPRLDKIGARIVRHGRYVFFQLAEIASSLRSCAGLVGCEDRLCRRRDRRNELVATVQGRRAMRRGLPAPAEPAAQAHGSVSGHSRCLGIAGLGVFSSKLRERLNDRMDHGRWRGNLPHYLITTW